MVQVVELGSFRCLVVGDDDPSVGSVRDMTDLIGDALGEEATLVAVTVERLDPSFFQLRSGFAGEVLQKAANYGIKLAVIGDISEHVAASNAFRDLVVESKRSRSFFFEPDIRALGERLAEAERAGM
jgi:Domain of unknown function (DUF4180)